MSDAETIGRAVRGARNQALYRLVNERVRELNDAFDPLPPLGEWICECANEKCFEEVLLTHAEYEAVRAFPTRFFVKPHDDHVVRDSSASPSNTSATGSSRKSELRPLSWSETTLTAARWRTDLGRSQPGPLRAEVVACSEALDHAGDRLAEADAHAADSVALAAPLELAEQRGRDSRPGGAQRVPE